MGKMIDLFTFSGKVGDLVGCKGPTGFYIRSRPRKSSKPPTAKQLEARARLALVMDFLTPLREIAYRGFAGKNGSNYKTGALAKAISHATRHAVSGGYPDLYINPAEIRLSQGDLLPLQTPAAVLDDDGLLRITWDNAANQTYAFDDDRVFAIAYQHVAKNVVVGESLRSTGLVSMDVSMEPTGTAWLVYACVAERDFSRFANSQFLGEMRTVSNKAKFNE